MKSKKAFLKQNIKLKHASKCSTFSNVEKNYKLFDDRTQTYLSKYDSFIESPVIKGKTNLFKTTKYPKCAKVMNGMLCAIILEDIKHTGAWRPIKSKERISTDGINHLLVKSNVYGARGNWNGPTIYLDEKPAHLTYTRKM